MIEENQWKFEELQNEYEEALMDHNQKWEHVMEDLTKDITMDQQSLENSHKN